MDFLDSQRDNIYYYVQGVLDKASKTQTSSLQVAKVIDAVRSVFEEACADHAQVWNRQNSHVGVAGHLPAEILTNCFSFTGFGSLVRATHVCRRWRALALADRRLWATFRYGTDRYVDYDMGQARVEQLSVMLDRSRPVPFTLQLPSSASWDKERLLSVLQDDIWRLESYTGTRDLYLHLNPDGEPMPYITQIDFLTEYIYPNSGRDPVFAFPPDWGTRGVPNLRRLVAPTISIAANCDPLLKLEYLCLTAAGISAGYRRLFDCCPNLATLKLLGVGDDTVLPVAPLPKSLNTVELQVLGGISVEFASLLSSWSGQPITSLTVYGARRLSASVDFFISSYPGTIAISMTRNEVTISPSDSASALSSSASAPEKAPQHVVYPFTWREYNQLCALRGPCADRLTALTLQGRHFWDLFNAHVTAPRLTSLEFEFDVGSTDACPIPVLPCQAFSLVAPSLRDMVICVPFDAQSMRGDKWCSDAVTAMCQSLRLLIEYDAALLETMTVHGSREVIAFLGCRDLSEYAKTYAENPSTL